jgi:NADPH2:quinone reductase
VPNQDGAGEIDAVGAGVPESRIGERVWVYFAALSSPFGTAAEYTVVPAEHAVPLPDGVSLELGASLGIPALTAHRCLTADGSLDGQTVLVAGGAGAVGHYAIELAPRLGAERVVATASTPEKQEVARAAGAAVVDYRAQDAAVRIRLAAPHGVHRIVEVALTSNLELDLGVLTPNGTIVSYATGGSPLRADVRRLMDANVTLRFVLVYGTPRPALEQAVADITSALVDGALTLLPLHRFPLDEIGAAHEAVEQGVLGKVIVDIP